ncbi:MAG: SH3 domain-containing protein [Anaerolineae bacterium]|nr:SH3 domain-containing protein [Anaerolineae bacterium]
MSTTTPSHAIVRGIPDHPEINVRTGPGTGYRLAFKLPVETRAEIIDALTDATENHFQGKIYQWLRLRLADGREGWVRDDLLDLAPGDHRAAGYPVLGVRTYAFALQRDLSKRPSAYPPPITSNIPDEAGDSAGPSVEPVPPDAPESEDAGPLWIPADDEEAPEPADEPESDAGPLWIPADESHPVVDEEVPETEAESPEDRTETPPPVPPGCDAIVIGAQTAINVRSGPATTYAVVTRLERGARLPVQDVRPEDGGGAFKWVRVDVLGKEGWIREDLLSFQGTESVSHGLIPSALLYPAPMALPEYWWVRGFTGPLPNHAGWDLGARTGEPVLAGPQGGSVIVSFSATKATPTKPSIIDHGWALGDPRVFSDPGWGFGYGNYVIVRYLNEQLPPYTRAALASQGMPGAAAFVMYAHLHTRGVFQGQEVGPGEPIGTCGSTGNSQAPHVHLEVRASVNPGETSWARLAGGLIDPGLLFNR